MNSFSERGSLIYKGLMKDGGGCIGLACISQRSFTESAGGRRTYHQNSLLRCCTCYKETLRLPIRSEHHGLHDYCVW